MSEHKKIVSMFWWVVFFEREAAVVGMAMARTYTDQNWNAAISILKPDLCYIWIFLNKVQFPPFTCGSIDSVYLPILDRDLAEVGPHMEQSKWSHLELFFVSSFTTLREFI